MFFFSICEFCGKSNNLGASKIFLSLYIWVNDIFHIKVAKVRWRYRISCSRENLGTFRWNMDDLWSRISYHLSYNYIFCFHGWNGEEFIIRWIANWLIFFYFNNFRNRKFNTSLNLKFHIKNLLWFRSCTFL